MADEKTTVLGIRLDADERKRFDEFVSEEGKNNKEFLNTLLNLYELNKGKVKNISLVGDIEVLESYTNKIQQSFINIIDKLESQKGDIKEQSQKDLQIYKEKVNDLQNEFDSIKLLNSTNEEKLTSVNNDNIALKEQNNQLQANLSDKMLIVEEYKQKNDMLLDNLKEYKQYKIELEEYKKLLADSQTKNIDLNNSIKEKDFAINSLTKNIDELKQFKEENKKIKELLAIKQEDNINLINSIKEKDLTINSLNKDIESLRQDYEKQLGSIKKENELNIKLAVAEIKEELNAKLNQEQVKHNKEIEVYQSKYKALLEQLEIIRATSKVPPEERNE